MTRNPLIIGNKEFKYQKDALAYFYRMLLRYQNLQIIHGQDHDLLSSLIEYHPNAHQKIGVGIKTFFKARTKKGTSCFWLERKDGTTIDFSFITAVKAKGKFVRDNNRRSMYSR